MAIKPLNHYAITNLKPSVYEEETPSMLELVGRIGQRLNEAIAAYNELEENTDEKLTAYNEFIKIMNEVTMPEKVKYEVDLHIARGDFDRAISIYLGDLESRVDNLLSAIPEGSTTMDAEIIDARLGADGVAYENAGEAIRGQYNDLSVSSADKRSIMAERYGYRYNYNRPSLWEQGWYNSETGEPGNTGTDYQTFIRTRDFIPSNIARVISPKLRLEIFVYKKSNSQFEYKLDLRVADYPFDHSGYKYKIHATGYDENILNFHNTKVAVTVADAKDIYFLSGVVAENPDTVSASAFDLGYKRDLNYRSLWSQGYIYGSDGSYGIDPRGYDYWLYSRSDYLPESVEAVAVKPGFKARLFRYKDEEFVDFVNVSVSPVKLAHEVYQYRIDVTYTANVLGDRHDVCDMWSNVLLLSDPVPVSENGESGEAKSPFDKDVFLPTYIHSEYFNTDCYEFSADDVAEVYSALDEISDTYWEKFTIGSVSDPKSNHILPIHSYCSYGRYVEGSERPKRPTILIVGGQHGFEKGNVYGIINFMKNMKDMYDSYPTMIKLYDHLIDFVDFIIVPVLNPYGYDYGTYKNANGVNLNRNYDYKWVHVDDTESEQYGGEAPFDQVETQAIRNLILEEKPFLVIDSHSKGSGVVTDSRDLNWIIAPGETDSYYKRLANACYTHLVRQNSVSPEGQTGYYEGFDGTVNTTPSLDNWCVYNNKIMSLTFEGHNGYGEVTHPYDQPNISRNTDQLLNFIASVIEEFSRR